jgi:FkbM family methyltransferase
MKMETEECTIKHVGAKMIYRPDISVGRMLKYTNIWEEPTVKALLEIKAKDQMYLSFEFLDIGAHWGYYSVIVSHLWPQAKIHAFEPLPLNLEVLEQNLISKPNAIIHPTGVGETNDPQPYWVGTMESGRGTFVQENVHEILERDSKFVMCELPMTNIEDIEVLWPLVGLVKIDVQGMEHTILRKVLSLVGQNSCWIIVENSKEVSNLITEMRTMFSSVRLLPDNNWLLMKIGGRLC